VSLSVADAFYAARHFLLRPESDEYHPDKVHGFLAEPEGVTQPTTLTADEIRALAAPGGPDRFLPPYFDLGGRHIGPADLLFAMLGAAEGAEAVTVTPRRQQCEYEDVYPALRDLRFAGTWMRAEDFADRFLSDRLRLQAWTIRPEAAGGIR